MTQIARRPDLEAFFMEAMKDSFAKEERTFDEIHVSDLLALRKAYWSRVEPRPLTTDEVGYFVAGRGHEGVAGRIAGVEPGLDRVVEGIILRPDFYGTIPLEFKTRRRKLAATPEEVPERYGSYVDQCRAYAALLNRPAAWLWVLGLVQTQDDGTTKPEFQVWQVDFTPEELAETLELLRIRRDKLGHAWKAAGKAGGSPEVLQAVGAELDLCPEWQCGRASVTPEPWTCDGCDQLGVGPHCLTCHRFFAGDWGAERHVTSKTGAGHVTIKGKTRTTYIPRCRWWDVCQPWRTDPARGPSDPEAGMADGVPGDGEPVGAVAGATGASDSGSVAGEPREEFGWWPRDDSHRADSWDF